jgi:hypothetical protein
LIVDFGSSLIMQQAYDHLLLRWSANLSNKAALHQRYNCKQTSAPVELPKPGRELIFDQLFWCQGPASQTLSPYKAVIRAHFHRFSGNPCTKLEIDQ